MKKTARKKMSLNRETMRTLTAQETAQAAGALPPSFTRYATGCSVGNYTCSWSFVLCNSDDYCM